MALLRFSLLWNFTFTDKSKDSLVILAEIQKTPLALVMDNSASINYLKADENARQVYQQLSTNKALQDKFEIQTYRFDSEFQTESVISKAHNPTLRMFLKI